MAKVDHPLGGNEAHGALGQAVIYQVTSVKGFATPRNPKSVDQTANRDKFSDLGGIVVTAGRRARETLRTTFGAYWNSRFTKQMMLDLSGYYAEALTEWSNLSGPVKAEWEAVAPYRATKTLTPGQLFYMLAVGAYGDNEDLFSTLGACYTPASAVAAWWNAGLEGIIVGGRTDGLDPAFVWSDQHHTVSNGAAWAGSYEQSSEVYYPSCKVLFYGRRLTWGFAKGPDFGDVDYESENGYQFTFSQYAASWSYQQTRQGVLKAVGLHVGKLLPKPPGVINVDFVDVE
jgi:hypothetical protein